MKQLNSLLSCHNRLRLFTAIAIAIIFFIGCEKDPEPLFDNGTITGKITMRTLSYNYINGEGVQVIAHGPYGSKSTLSKSDGRYTLSGLGNGTYEIEFNKDGYGITRLQGNQIFGNDTLSLSANLYQKADYKLPKLTAYGGTIIRTDLPSADFYAQIRVFLSNTKSVNCRNYLYTQMAYTSEGQNNIVYLEFDSDPRYPFDGSPKGGSRIFESGKSRYMIAYVCSSEDPGSFDEYFNLMIYTTADENQHSQVFEFKPL